MKIKNTKTPTKRAQRNRLDTQLQTVEVDLLDKVSGGDGEDGQLRPIVISW